MGVLVSVVCMISDEVSFEEGEDSSRTVGSDLLRAPFLAGLLGSEAFSLSSDTLIEGRRGFPLVPLCWNLTSFRDLAMAQVGGGSEGDGVLWEGAQAAGGCEVAGARGWGTASSSEVGGERKS